MNVILPGQYSINCVLIDSETVLNNEGIQSLIVQSDRWSIEPSGQQFRVLKTFRNAAMLNSNGHTYIAEYRWTDENVLAIDLKREGVNQTISIEAVPSPVAVATSC